MIPRNYQQVRMWIQAVNHGQISINRARVTTTGHEYNMSTTHACVVTTRKPPVSIGKTRACRDSRLTSMSEGNIYILGCLPANGGQEVPDHLPLDQLTSLPHRLIGVGELPGSRWGVIFCACSSCTIQRGGGAGIVRTLNGAWCMEDNQHAG